MTMGARERAGHEREPFESLDLDRLAANSSSVRTRFQEMLSAVFTNLANDILGVMEMYQTALGRLVPIDEAQTVLEDAILKLLFEYRMNPQNPENVPMKLSRISHAVSADPRLVAAALDALREKVPALVEERETFQQERTFRLTGSGVGFVRNMPQVLSSIL